MGHDPEQPGQRYNNRIRATADNIEQAIQLRSDLKVYTQKGFPKSGYDPEQPGRRLRPHQRPRITSSRPSSIAIWPEGSHPGTADWAATQNNLAAAYDRIRATGRNIEQAVQHCDLALKVYTQKDFWKSGPWPRTTGPPPMTASGATGQ